MLVFTENSLYLVQGNGDHYLVTKIDSRNTSTGNGSVCTGKNYIADHIYVKVGERARLGLITTSNVMSVRG